MLDIGDFIGGQRLSVSVVESAPILVYERTCLVNVLTQHLTQSGLE
jgi:hypothetical protein